jgi:hypothetical protein
MPKPWTHLLEVEMRLKVPANLNVPNQTNLIMPVLESRHGSAAGSGRDKCFSR